MVILRVDLLVKVTKSVTYTLMSNSCCGEGDNDSLENINESNLC